MSFYKKFLSFFLVSLCSFLAGKVQAQQNFPVQANLLITPPYSLYLSDYSSAGSQKMQLNLFLKDLNKQNYPFRLKVKIEGLGISIYSKPDFSVQPFYLNAGELRVISGDDLAPYLDANNLVFQGLSLSDFQNTGGKLPEGVYRITLQVQDYYNKKIVSNDGTMVLAAYLSYPPIVNLPLPGSKVTVLEPQNVMFQWTPRHTGSINAAYNVAYKFTLVELNPPTRDPNNAMQSTVPFYETFTDQTFLMYGATEPPLVKGNCYAAKIQAVEASGKDIFLNDGNSEVIKFTYGNACETPINILAEIASTSSLKVSWMPWPGQQDFIIAYREANKPTAVWFEQDISETSYTITGLQAGRTYEYKVKGKCASGNGIYSEAQWFQMPTEDLSTGNLVCGMTETISGLDNDALNFLKPGMFFMAGAFPVTVTEVNGSNGVFTGKGTIGIPFLNAFKFIASFEGVSINTNLKMISGVVKVATQSLDQSKEQLASQLTITPDGNGNVNAIYNDALPNIVNVTIPNPEVLPVYHPENNTVTFTGTPLPSETNSTPAPKTITIKLAESQPPYVFQDKNGETYEVAKDASGTTTVTRRGKIPTSDMLAGNSKTSKPINTEKARIDFAAAGQKYGFDTYTKDVSGNKMNWKSVESGRGDQFTATLVNADPAIIADSLQFRNGNNEHLSATRSGNEFTLNVIGAPEANDKEVYAYYSASKGGDAGTYLAKLNVASFKKITKKVVIVPVNNASGSLSAESIKNYLNTVYKQAVVDWEVEFKESFTFDLGLDGLQSDNSGLLSAYTTEQKALASAYKKAKTFEDGKYYLFLVNSFSVDGQDGYMVRNGQVGFVKAAATNVLRTIAHELGHGAFSLKHAWEEFGTTQGQTANLMDYSSGEELCYGQWKYMRNPDWVFKPFEGDGNGAYQTDGHYSTVYLVSLMLGMEGSKAWELAKATEDPDTDIHSDIDFELDQTWIYPWAQTATHSLTGGFHGIEELMTAFKFLYTDRDDVKKLGKLLHRYGDTYAHTRLDNLNPEDCTIDDMDHLNDEEKIKYYVNAWKEQGGLSIAKQVEPWIRYLNFYIRKYGYEFLTTRDLQIKALGGMTIPQYLHEVYLKNQPPETFKMYGNGSVFGTGDHFISDGSIPDYIYVRPKWYLTYVKNLASLIASKYNLNVNNLDISKFDKMVSFASAHNCHLKGIIDYEIASRLKTDKSKPTVFYIPVLYASTTRSMAKIDELFVGDYLKAANDALAATKKYLAENQKQIIAIKEKTTREALPAYPMPLPYLQKPQFYDKLWAYQIIVR